MKRSLALVSLVVCTLAWSRAAHAASINVPAGGDLQAALNAALPGDTIYLAAGATFKGPYKLPAKSGTSYITIRSSAPDSSLPAAGTRISPSYASQLPKIASIQGGPAMRTSAGASYWRIMFVEFLPSTSTASANLLELGALDASQSSLSSVPHHLVIDRCYFHGDPGYGQRRAIALHSGDTQILNSYFADIKQNNTDTQTIGGANGPGPYLIENNYLEAAGENVMFGGSDPYIPNLIPSNITIRRNYFTKPTSWMTQTWTVKNLLELKNAEHVLIEGNTFEHSWSAGQDGYAIQLTPRNQSNTAPWSVVGDVTIQNNIIRDSAGVVNICGYDDVNQSQQTHDIVIRNNLIWGISKTWAAPSHTAYGWFAQIGAAPKNITIDHNTIDNDGTITVALYGGTTPTGIHTIAGFELTNNLLRDNKYGIFGDNSSTGIPTLTKYTPSAVVLRNTLAGGSVSSYPTGNFFPTLATWLADFVSAATGNYALTSGSTFHSAGTDGKDLGVDFTELNSALSGTTGTPPPPPPPPPPSPSDTPVALPGRIEAENYNHGGEGVAYHDTTPGNNNGGVYRTDDVDIRVTTDVDGAYNLKAVRATEWLAYAVSIATGGTYNIDLRIASAGAGGSAHIEIDGANVSGSIALPDTGGWNTWKTVTKTGVSLPAGTHTLKLVIDTNGPAGTAADINWIGVSAATGTTTGSTPFTGTPVALPGIVQAENYDRGGEGIAYHDTTPGNNNGGVYRTDDVDIRVTTDVDGAYNLKAVRATEWLAYAVSLATGGTYNIDLRIASAGAGGSAHIEIDGANVSGSIALPDTGGWNTWKTVTKTGVSLPAGAHTLKLVIDTNGPAGTAADINWIGVSAATQ